MPSTYPQLSVFASYIIAVMASVATSITSWARLGFFLQAREFQARIAVDAQVWSKHFETKRSKLKQTQNVSDCFKLLVSVSRPIQLSPSCMMYGQQRDQ